MNLQPLYELVGSRFRGKRMRSFAQEFAIDVETTVLDVGGTAFNWSLLETPPRIVLLNITPVESANIPQVIADGRFLPFVDGSFDILFSNSVIEHLYTEENQRNFARECMRVGERYYVQTPNRWFPIEPHYIAPFIHWFPKELQKILIKNFTIRGWLTRPSQDTCNQMVEEIRLLDVSSLQQMFPDGHIWQERFGGLVKSLIIVRY